MEHLLDMQVTIPIAQIAILLFLSTLVMLSGKFRLTLIIHYLFLFFWAYLLVENVDFIRGTDDIDFKAAAAYYGFGLVIVILAILGLLRHQE